MFVAWRELRFARGRFLLIGSVVALITVLVGFLSGLTAGLASQNISSVLQIPGDRIVLQQPASGTPSFATSAIDDATVKAWSDADGVTSVTPIGITQSRVSMSGADDPVGVALYGIPTDVPDADGNALVALAPAHDDEVGLSKGAASDLDASVGDTITLAGDDYTVASIGGDLWYSHTPVITMTPDAWSAASARTGGSGEATALSVSSDADWQAIGDQTGTKAETTLSSLTALEAFRSEIGSLGLMIAMLFGISALVVGAFFTVWTMQRSGDIAVLKALGATTGSLVRDSLGQALIVLVAGIGLGNAVVAGVGMLVGSALPFIVSPLTTIAPAAIMALLGLAGAAFALRSVTNADPLTALGSNR
ncbi:ABC transporter substrate-binding protein [Microbacterium sorbitolivorans]|uniref:ABC transporter permease n=1 Tax=Microbacterium sorbitolivorans TaxID=1867410 RepID=A0A367Y907_9MICO|nr:ABC transporter permease [Microbacterium sorbitolivorans]RCK61481.1 ABC transporter permease [Microbacterium sorbitolivorans]GGF31808.1 ABC transporter substrate-binding protein [Microbacterium sorbitolivorans]